MYKLILIFAYSYSIKILIFMAFVKWLQFSCFVTSCLSVIFYSHFSLFGFSKWVCYPFCKQMIFIVYSILFNRVWNLVPVWEGKLLRIVFFVLTHNIAIPRLDYIMKLTMIITAKILTHLFLLLICSIHNKSPLNHKVWFLSLPWFSLFLDYFVWKVPFDYIVLFILF